MVCTIEVTGFVKASIARDERTESLPRATIVCLFETNPAKDGGIPPAEPRDALYHRTDAKSQFNLTTEVWMGRRVDTEAVGTNFAFVRWVPSCPVNDMESMPRFDRRKYRMRL